MLEPSPLPSGSSVADVSSRCERVQSWIAQWSDQYNQHFFVNTNGVGGAESHWVHPNETERQNAKSTQSYAPPPGAPPTGNSDSKTPAYNAPPAASPGIGASSSPAPQSQYDRDSGAKKGGLFGKLKEKLNAPPSQGASCLCSFSRTATDIDNPFLGGTN